MEKGKLLAELHQVGLLIKGHFKLSGGAHTDTYIDKNVIYSYPWLIPHIAKNLADAITDSREHGDLELPGIIISPAIGALILGHATILELGKKVGGYPAMNMRFAWCERDDNKKMVLRRGFEKIFKRDQSGYRGKVCIIEDVLTTGKSVREVKTLVESHGVKVDSVAAAFNRGQVTKETLGVEKLVSLFDMTLPSWTPNECLLCGQGVPLDHNLGHG
jgi:orotate phosphoribosyltransferase